MAATLNKVMLIGRLGNDPELRFTANGNAVANFNLATDSQSRDGEKITEWHRIVVWGKQAELVSNYVSKGRVVYVEGSLRTRKWVDRDGQTRWTTEIVAQQVLFLDQKPPEIQPSQARPQPTPQQPTPSPTPQPDMPEEVPTLPEDDIPF